MGLKQIREEIDAIDSQMKELFQKRMELSRQVIESKKQTKAAVYVPEREQEVLEICSDKVAEELVSGIKAFFRKIMEISRNYQYAQLVEEEAELMKLLQKEGSVSLCFDCPQGSGQFASCLSVLTDSGLTPEEILAERQGDAYHCRIRISGDFSVKSAKAAALFVRKETEHFTIN